MSRRAGRRGWGRRASSGHPGAPRRPRPVSPQASTLPHPRPAPAPAPRARRRRRASKGGGGHLEQHVAYSRVALPRRVLERRAAPPVHRVHVRPLPPRPPCTKGGGIRGGACPTLVLTGRGALWAAAARVAVSGVSRASRRGAGMSGEALVATSLTTPTRGSDRLCTERSGCRQARRQAPQVEQAPTVPLAAASPQLLGSARRPRVPPMPPRVKPICASPRTS